MSALRPAVVALALLLAGVGAASTAQQPAEVPPPPPEAEARGLQLLAEGKPREAADALEEADRLGGCAAECLLALSRAYSEVAQFERAGETARRVVDSATEPADLARGHVQLATTLEMTGAPAAAWEAYEKGVELTRQTLPSLEGAEDPIGEAHLRLAALLIGRGWFQAAPTASQGRDYAEGLDLARRYLAQHPEGEGAAVARRLLCGSPTCSPAPFAVEAVEDPSESRLEVPLEAPLRLSGNVTAPKKLNAPPPQYVESARRARVQGVVILEAIIDRDGEVANVRALKSLPLGLTESAIAAVRQWRFEPATLDGRPVNVYYSLTVNFQLESDPPP